MTSDAADDVIRQFSDSEDENHDVQIEIPPDNADHASADMPGIGDDASADMPGIADILVTTD